MDLADAAHDSETQARAAALAAVLYAAAGSDPGPLWRDGKAYCRECDGLIPERRLLAVPGTGLCVSCAEELQGA